MFRGYIRVRPGGPPKEAQETALKAAGIVMDGAGHWPIYVDEPIGRKRIRPDDDPLPMRAFAIRSLRADDVLVTYDAATLGLSGDDVSNAMGAIGRRQATLLTAKTGATYRWHPDAAEIATMAADAGDQIRRERTAKAIKRALELGLKGGRPEKLTGERLTKARAWWADPALTGNDVVEKLRVECRLRISLRTLHNRLGNRVPAVEKQQRKKLR